MGKEQGSMEQNQIRLLGPDEIECRIGTISEKGLSLLLYKDARELCGKGKRAGFGFF